MMHRITLHVDDAQLRELRHEAADELVSLPALLRRKLGLQPEAHEDRREHEQGVEEVAP
jgi:hypothetical protein